jgi:hypothetical protein
MTDDPRAKNQAMDGRFRIRVSGTAPLADLMRTANELKKQALEEAAGILDDLRREIEAEK